MHANAGKHVFRHAFLTRVCAKESACVCAGRLSLTCTVQGLLANLNGTYETGVIDQNIHKHEQSERADVSRYEIVLY